jgi:hypothetical protein
MAHPFEKMFDAAIRKSTPLDNQVLETALQLRDKGYPATEICEVLIKLEKSLIDKEEAELVAEAIAEFGECD